MNNDWNATDYSTHGRFVSDYGKNLIDLLDPKPQEKILDLGCGDGVLTQELAKRGAQVIGIDSSPDLLKSARALGLDVREMDARNFHFSEPFDEHFDAVFSNAVLHWIPEAEKVLSCVYQALKPGGRFVAEMGGEGNIQTIRQAFHSHPLVKNKPKIDFYPSKEEYQQKLEQQGFQVESIELYPRWTPLPKEGLAGWLKTFRSFWLQGLSQEEIDEVISSTLEQCRDKLFKEGQWHADYVRLRFIAFRP
jgi:trans-aconitate methyltransferase